MCGIVGCNGNIDTTKFLIKGLNDLDYRGYDSAGIAFISGGEINVFKALGLVDNLKKEVPTNILSSMGIGHTRWATHGKVTIDNCHPIMSNSGLITLIHNGMCENAPNLKEYLVNKGYEFYSETDTEVIANLLEDAYYQNDKKMKKTICDVMKKITGSYACVFMVKGDDNRLFFMKSGSPLLIGKGDGFNLVASDSTPMIAYTHLVYPLKDYEFGFISPNEIRITNTKNRVITPKFYTIDPDLGNKHLNKRYNHYMIQETDEISTVLRKLCENNTKDGAFTCDFDLIKELKESDHIILLGCGTSYHASLFGRRIFNNYGKAATSYIASEWIYSPEIVGNKPFIIMLSQSGETADVIHALKIAQVRKIKTLIICNNKGSTLDRECDYSLLLNCGVEIGVASTKAYVAMCAMLGLLAHSLYNQSGKFIQDLANAITIIDYIKVNMKNKIRNIALSVKNSSNIFFVGRGNAYDLVLEASLKLKEISYIHSEAYAGGELKHGPIALIDIKFPVIAFISDPAINEAMRNNILQTASRGARSIVFSTKSVAQEGDALVLEDFDPALTCIVMSPIAFYFAYYLAVAKGLNPDKPRNLAKAVTVE